MAKFKNIEQIRKDAGYTQIQWASVIGSTYRTYSARLKGDQPEWKLNEVIKASEYNEGKIIIPTPLGDYEISVKKL